MTPIFVNGEADPTALCLHSLRKHHHKTILPFVDGLLAMIKYSISVPQEPPVGWYQWAHVGNVTVKTASRILTINPKVLYHYDALVAS